MHSPKKLSVMVFISFLSMLKCFSFLKSALICVSRKKKWGKASLFRRFIMQNENALLRKRQRFAANHRHNGGFISFLYSFLIFFNIYLLEVETLRRSFCTNNFRFCFDGTRTKIRRLIFSPKLNLELLKSTNEKMCNVTVFENRNEKEKIRIIIFGNEIKMRCNNRNFILNIFLLCIK